MILCGDIGATKSLLGLVDEAGGSLTPQWVERHVNACWPAFDDLLRHFLAEGAAGLGREIRLEAAGFGIAGPVETAGVTMTNLAWHIAAAPLAETLGGCPVCLLNDLEAAVADGEAAWRRAIDGRSPAARRALDLFIDCYGAVAGDHALTSLARGGVYLVGAIAAQVLQGAEGERFIAAFCDKGALSALAARMPVQVVRDLSLPLRGAARSALRLVGSA